MAASPMHTLAQVCTLLHKPSPVTPRENPCNYKKSNRMTLNWHCSADFDGGITDAHSCTSLHTFAQAFPGHFSLNAQSSFRFITNSVPLAGATVAYTELPILIVEISFFSLAASSTRTSPSSSPIYTLALITIGDPHTAASRSCVQYGLPVFTSRQCRNPLKSE